MRNRNRIKILSLLVVLLLRYGNIYAQYNNAPGDWQGPQTLQQLVAAPAALIPFPQQAKWSRDDFFLKQNTVIAYAESEAAEVSNAARSLEELLTANTITTKRSTLKSDGTPLNNAIQLESYHFH